MPRRLGPRAEPRSTHRGGSSAFLTSPRLRGDRLFEVQRLGRFAPRDEEKRQVRLRCNPEEGSPGAFSMSMPRVLISDALSPAAVQIFKDRGVAADFQPDLGKDRDRL